MGPKKQIITRKFVIDLVLDLSEKCEDHVVDQLNVSRPVAAKDRAQPHSRPCGLYGGQSGTATFICPSTSVFLSQHHSANAPYS